MNTISQVFIVLMLFAFALSFMAKVREQEKLYFPLKLIKSVIFVMCGCVSIKVACDGVSWLFLFVLGLVFGLLGDVALDIKRIQENDKTPTMIEGANLIEANRSLKAGMIFFFVGHLCYIIAFADMLKFSIKVWVIALIVMVLLFLVLWFIETKLKFLKVNFGSNADAVYIYNVILSVLLGLMIGYFLTTGSPIAKHLLGSIALFYLSDFILIFNYFSPLKEKKAIKVFEMLNHLTYYAAQLGIALVPLFFI
ncbi:MAG: lysoplasmalogenase [Clostridia bacterium]|nr:lysoplasmalogenase [Clostridia bacterium]